MRKERTSEGAFAGLADPTRRKILRLIRDRAMPAGRIAAHFPQQRPAISKHLSILKRAGLIRESRNRQQRIYRLNGQKLGPIMEYLHFLAEPSLPPSEPATNPPVARNTEPPSIPSSPKNADLDLEFD